MADAFSRLKSRRARLPDPPADMTENLQAPEMAPLEPEQMSSRSSSLAIGSRQQPAQPRQRIDGRIRLRKDRTEALSTKIKPHHRDLLMSLADVYDTTLSETLEKAIEALEAQARKEGRLDH